MRISRTACSVLLALLPGLRAAGQTPAEPPVTQPERPTGPVDSCATAECHTKTMAGRFLHGPTAQKQCESCHVAEDVRKHTFGLVVPKSELCVYCHTKAERTVVHKPVADRECVKCHDPHGSDYPKSLLGDPSGALCLPCHKPKDHGRGGQGGNPPQTVGACNVCHEPHSSWLPKLLPAEPPQLCLTCHEDMWTRVELVGNSHAPVQQGRCLACHDAHTTGHPRQLRDAVPQLCFSCHEHDAMRMLVETSAVVHGALSTDESCRACHVGHSSVLPFLLAGSEKELCLSCHNEPLLAQDGHTIADMAFALKANPRHHGPIREGKCTPCHDPHASPRAALLRKDYPGDFYAPFDIAAYALCFECHVERLAMAEDAVGATGFRDQERNLHLLHVNKERRGRNCLACHEVHASGRAFHIRDTVPFGPRDWEIEINYTRLPNGGMCLPACHEAKAYDRGQSELGEAPPAGLKPEYQK